MNDVYELTRRIEALEKEIDRLKRATANLPIRTSGGGGGGGVTLSESDLPEDIIATGDTIGDSDNAAHGNHTHHGQPFVSQATAPGSAIDGTFYYNTTNKKIYARCNSAWVCISHMETP